MEIKNRAAEWQRKRIFQIIEVGTTGDRASRAYDFLGAFAIIVNLAASIFLTFQDTAQHFGGLLTAIEGTTVVFFAADYALRLWTAKFLRPNLSEARAVLQYAVSFTGLVDLFSFLPYFLPFFFPAGTVAFRMFRIVRIFRLFRINAYYDSLNVIGEVIAGKRQQLISSVFIILVLMLAASLCMYSLEHEAQPEVFTNAFSGIWWSASTLLTVGYGDIYPITSVGKVFGIFITFLGVGMVAIPTGIISAGFVDQYSRLKRITEYAGEEDIRFIKIRLEARDKWAHRTISELRLPRGVIVAAIQRGRQVIVPRGDISLLPGDALVLGAEALRDNQRIQLKEVELLAHHPWNGQAIHDLDISRKTVIVMVKRAGKTVIPNGDLILREGDKVVLYTQKHLSHAREIEV